MSLTGKLLQVLPQASVEQIVALASSWADEARVFARETLGALWLMLLVACCTTPVILRTLLDVLTAQPHQLAAAPGRG